MRLKARVPGEALFADPSSAWLLQDQLQSAEKESDEPWGCMRLVTASHSTTKRMPWCQPHVTLIWGGTSQDWKACIQAIRSILVEGPIYSTMIHLRIALMQGPWVHAPIEDLYSETAALS